MLELFWQPYKRTEYRATRSTVNAVAGTRNVVLFLHYLKAMDKVTVHSVVGVVFRCIVITVSLLVGVRE